jgi:hypothetical protein
MKITRLILIFALGGYLTYLTYKSKYGVSIIDAIISGGLIFLGAILLLWTIFKDIKLYKEQKKIQSFALTSICLLFVSVIVVLQIKIHNDFNKPTLLKAYYNGDYNGTKIDFKTDGTYVFENYAIGLSDYYFGNYNIIGNKITLDRDTIDNLTNLRNLEVREKAVQFKAERKSMLYLFQVDVNGNIVNGSCEYRVVVDNRRR